MILETNTIECKSIEVTNRIQAIHVKQYVMPTIPKAQNPPGPATPSDRRSLCGNDLLLAGSGGPPSSDVRPGNRSVFRVSRPASMFDTAFRSASSLIRLAFVRFQSCLISQIVLCRLSARFLHHSVHQKLVNFTSSIF